MHHAVAMRVVERDRHLGRDTHRVGQRKRSLAHEASAERVAADERHYIIEERRRLAGVVERQNVGVLELGDELDFTQKALCAECHAQLGIEHLDGDVTVVAQVLGEKHRGHAAAADLSFEDVAVRECARESAEWSGQRGSGAGDE